MTLTVCMAWACGQESESNPFFSKWETPYEIPDFGKIKYEHYLPAYQEGIKREAAEIQAIIDCPDAPTFENTIVPYSSTGEFLSNVSAVFGNMCSTEMNDTFAELQKQITPLTVQHSDNIILNEKLFERIAAVYENMDGLDPLQKRTTEKIYKSFSMNGAALSDEKKEELRKINGQLSDLSLTFGNNLLKDNGSFSITITSEEDLKGLPESVIEAAKQGDGTWKFSLDKASMIPFLQYAENSDLRKELYDGYLNRCNNNNETDNKEIIEKIVNLRIERANILGYPTHAAFTLERCMATNADNVYDLLDKLWTPALKRANAELADMKKMKAAEGKGTDFLASDWWYYAEKVKQDKYALSEEMLRPYFSLENTRNGAFNLANKLWGLTFTEVSGVPVYNEECTTFDVKDVDGTHLGILIVDYHPRKSKRVGAWCSSFRSAKYVDGKRQAPLVINVCNFTPATESTPSLLTVDEVETLFHEFGHALHSLMNDVPYSTLRGVSRDFVELPSQIMENWATHKDYLKEYAKHYQTGEVIPDELIEKISLSSKFNQGFATTEYLAASLLDMDYHTLDKAQKIDVDAFEKKALADRGLMSEIAPRYHSTYFSHIFSGGYSSGYYSYIWAEVLDADAFRAFEESGDIFNPEIAKRFRDCVLSKGSSQDEMKEYMDFRGKAPQMDALIDNRGLN